MPLFLRSIWANPISRVAITLFIVTSIVFCGLFKVLLWGSESRHDEASFLFSLLFFTMASSGVLTLLVGKWTCNFYYRAKEAIELHKKVDKRIVEAMSDAPCPRTGLRLAAHDMGFSVDV